MDYSLETEFQNDLIPAEKIYWSGQPDPSVVFSSSDFFMIPFSLMWGGFAIFWELSVLGLTHFNKNSHGVPLFFVLWGIPFVGVGLYMIFGRFFFKVWKKKRTFYAVTNLRVLIVTEGFGRQVQAQFLNQIPVINKSIGRDGTGSLSFGSTSGFGSNYTNTGMDFFSRRINQGVLAFYDISQAEMIYQMINELRNKALEPK
jgi:hypothetical protein